MEGYCSPTNFFVGLVYIVRTADVLLLHHPVDKAVINYRHLKTGVYELGSGYIANIPKAVSLKIIETAHAVGYIYIYECCIAKSKRRGEGADGCEAKVVYVEAD